MQQKLAQEQEGAQPAGERHYFNSIETDEFVMPEMFEVEIRLADNQVSYSSN